MRECVIYARVSSKEQEREGFSIPAQLELLREYARRYDLKILQEFTEAETAKSAGREKFGELLNYIQARKTPLVVLVEKTDRLYRNIKDHVLVDDLIREKKTEIHLVKEGEILGEKATSHVKLIHRIKTAIAQNYVENLSEEVIKGQRQSVVEGNFPWPAPYGYQKINKLMLPHPDNARYVQEAFRLYSTGLYSIDACIKRLQESGLVYKPHAHKIGKTKLNEILKSRIYIGQVEYKGEVFPGKHEPLISMDTWFSVQLHLRKGNKPMTLDKKDFTYKGLLSCGECGAPLVGEHKKGGKYTYYRCVSMKNGCTQGYVNETVIDVQVQEHIDRMEFTEDLKASILEAVKGMDDIHDQTYQDELTALNNQLTRVRNARKKAYLDKVSGVIDDDLWIEISDETQNQIDSLEAKLARLNKADRSFYETAELYLELPESLNLVWKSATSSEKKGLLNLFTSNLKVKDGKADIELKEPFYYLSKTAFSTEWRGAPDRLRTFLTQHSFTIRELHKSLCT